MARARRLPRAAWALIASCALVAAGVEAGTRIAVDRTSTIQRRVAGEYQRARSIGAGGGRNGHVLVVGNSLLNEGVKFDRVQQELMPWDARRFVVENTYFYDWYYGLKRLYREGARPDAVVVVLSVGQWMSGTTRGDYSAQYLFSTQDLPEIGRELKLQPTEAADLAVANISKFWGLRAELRNVVLGRLMPDMGELMVNLQPVKRKPPTRDDVIRTVQPRMEKLKALTEAHGTELVLLLPPIQNPDDGGPSVIEAAHRAGVRILAPVASGAIPAVFYRDGLHLNAKGAAIFTDRLIEPLKSELAGSLAEREGTHREPTE